MAEETLISFQVTIGWIYPPLTLPIRTNASKEKRNGWKRDIFAKEKIFLKLFCQENLRVIIPTVGHSAYLTRTTGTTLILFILIRKEVFSKEILQCRQNRFRYSRYC